MVIVGVVVVYVVINGIILVQNGILFFMLVVILMIVWGNIVVVKVIGVDFVFVLYLVWRVLQLVFGGVFFIILFVVCKGLCYWVYICMIIYIIVYKNMVIVIGIVGNILLYLVWRMVDVFDLFQVIVYEIYQGKMKYGVIGVCYEKGMCGCLCGYYIGSSSGRQIGYVGLGFLS